MSKKKFRETVQDEYVDPDSDVVPQDDLVICPKCAHQFSAISVNDQKRIKKLASHKQKKAKKKK